jgi:hypothetical protein
MKPTQLTVDGREEALKTVLPAPQHDAPPLFTAPPTMRGQLPIDWDKIRDCSDVVQPEPFAEYDRDGNPGEGVRLDHIEHGRRVVDSAGNRFLLMGWGSVQGSVILRDRYRRMFHADGGMHFKEL